MSDVNTPVVIKPKENPVFFSIIDTSLRTYTLDGETFENKPVVLDVIMDGGVEVSPNVKTKTTELSNGQSVFYNQTRTDDSFKIKIIINRVYNYDTKQFEDVNWSANSSDKKVKKSGTVLSILDYWIRNHIPVYVVTEAIDVPNGEYLIIDNPSRKQEYDNSTIWELEFKKYDGNNRIQWNFESDKTDAAIKKYEKNKAAKAAKAKAAAKSKAKTSVPDESKLKKCKRSTLVYSKKKKSVTCVKYMQKILKKQGFYKSVIDGWYNVLTKNAVMAYQKKHKSWNLKATGKVDLYTFENLCGQIGRTKTIKSTLPKANKNGVIDLTKKKN